MTRSVTGIPPAKRRKFESARRTKHEDSSEEEEEEDEMDGYADSDPQEDAVRKNRRASNSPAIRNAGAATRGGAKAQTLSVDSPKSRNRASFSSPSHADGGSPTESPKNGAKAAAQGGEPRKMWPDRIEEVLLKHGGQGMAHEIHRWIEEDFMEETVGKPGWKNLVSAHLSSNKKFVREQRAGKQGGVWILRSMLHQSSERRQPIALMSRNNPSSQPAQQSQRIQLPSIHVLQPSGPLSPLPDDDQDFSPPNSRGRSKREP